MENERLTFEQVCERYEFADWELAALVEQGEIEVEKEKEKEGIQLFSPDEIIRFLRVTPCHVFSLDVAARICGKSASTLKQQARKGHLRSKKIGDRWATNVQNLEAYIKLYGRRV